MSDYRPLLDVLVEAAGTPQKKRGHRYGIKAVHADFEGNYPLEGGRAW